MSDLQTGSGARAAAHAVLDAVLGQGQALDDALAGSPALAGLSARDRAFARLMIATTLRRLGQIDKLVAHCLVRPLPHQAASVQNVLRLGATQIAFLGTPAHAAVNETVRLLRARRTERYRGLANAVLRRLVREGADLRKPHDAARLNTPDWLWQSWSRSWGEGTARAIAAMHLAEPPLDITVRDDPNGWAARLDAVVLATGTLRRRTGPVEDLPGFAEGGWWVQDAAAALAGRAVLAGLEGDPQGWRIADLCAAPGGKTAQFAAAGARVTALDISAERLARLARNLARLRLEAELVEADLRRWKPAQAFDAVLLDAPCSGTGTIRRHPDITWLKRPADVARMAELQRALLEAAARAVGPGGRLVYSVCSLQPEEGAMVVDAFLSKDGRFFREAIQPGDIPGADAFLSPAGDLRTLPCYLSAHGGLDGFYICRLGRRA